MSQLKESGLSYDDKGFLLLDVDKKVKAIDENVEKIVDFLMGQYQITVDEFKQQQAQSKILSRIAEQHSTQVKQGNTHTRHLSRLAESGVSQSRQLNQLLRETKQANITAKSSRIVHKENVKTASIPVVEQQNNRRVSTLAQQHKEKVAELREKKNAEQHAKLANRDSLGRFTAKNNSNPVKTLADAIKHANFQPQVESIDPNIQAVKELGSLFKPVGKMASLAFKPLSAIAKLRKRNEPLPKEEVEHNRKQLRLLQRIAEKRSDNGVLGQIARALTGLAGLLGSNGGVDIDIGGGSKGKNQGKTTPNGGVGIPDIEKRKNPQDKKDKWHQKISKFGKGAGVLGIGLSALGFLDWNEQSASEKGATVGRFVGGTGGMLGGAVAGATVGSAIPVVGTAIGGVLGGVLGGLGGGSIGEIIGEKSVPYISDWTNKLVAYNLPEKMYNAFSVPVVGVVSALSSAVNQISGFTQQTFSVINTHVDNVKKLTTDIYSSVSKGVGSAMSALSNLVPESIKTMTSSAGNYVSGAYNTAVNYTSSAMERVANSSPMQWIKNAHSTAVDWTSRNVIERGANAVGTVSNTVKNAVSGGQAKRQEMVFNAFKKAGFAHNEALALTAEVGRENEYDDKYLFGTHVDAGNGATNAGMISWQGSRRTALMRHLASRGVLDKNGNMIHGQQALDAQAEFVAHEMRTSHKKAGDAMRANQHLGAEALAPILGKQYVVWAYGQNRLRTGKAFDWQAHDNKRRNYLKQIERKAGVSHVTGKAGDVSSMPSTTMATKSMPVSSSSQGHLVAIMGDYRLKDTGIGSGDHYDLRVASQAGKPREDINKYLDRFMVNGKTLNNYKQTGKFMEQRKGYKHEGVDYGINGSFGGDKNARRLYTNPKYAVKGVKHFYDKNGGGWVTQTEFADGVKINTLHQNKKGVEEVVNSFKGGAIPMLAGAGEMMSDNVSNVATGAIGAMGAIGGAMATGINPLLMLPLGTVKAREKLAFNPNVKPVQPPVSHVPKAKDLKVTPVQQPLNTPKPLEVKVTNQQNEVIGQNVSDRTLAHALTGGIGERKV